MDNVMHGEQPAVSLAIPVLTRAIIIAAILGSTLTLLNQPSAIFGAAKVQRLSLILVYVTPFLVVCVSQILGIRQGCKALGWSAEFREGFAATLVSHGILARAVAVSLVAGGANTVIVAADGLAAGRGLGQLPVALIVQSLTLPIIFGAVSQTLAFRRTIGRAVFSAPAPAACRGQICTCS